MRSGKYLSDPRTEIGILKSEKYLAQQAMTLLFSAVKDQQKHNKQGVNKKCQPMR